MYCVNFAENALFRGTNFREKSKSAFSFRAFHTNELHERCCMAVHVRMIVHSPSDRFPDQGEAREVNLATHVFSSGVKERYDSYEPCLFSWPAATSFTSLLQ